MIVSKPSSTRLLPTAAFLALTLLGTVSGFSANTAIEPVPGTSASWTSRFENMNWKARQGGIDLLYIGDSIVQNYQRIGRRVWAHYYEDRNGMNLGITGDCTQQVLWRLDHGNIDGLSPKLAIVMIGQNNGPSNTGEEIAEGVIAVVQKLRAKSPRTKILLLAIFFRGEKPTPERKVLTAANSLLAKFADNQMVFYMDINPIFLRPDGTIPASLMPDFEHPNEQGLKLWAETIEPKVAELFGDKPKPPMP